MAPPPGATATRASARGQRSAGTGPAPGGDPQTPPVVGSVGSANMGLPRDLIFRRRRRLTRGHQRGRGRHPRHHQVPPPHPHPRLQQRCEAWAATCQQEACPRQGRDGFTAGRVWQGQGPPVAASQADAGSQDLGREGEGEGRRAAAEEGGAPVAGANQTSPHPTHSTSPTPAHPPRRSRACRWPNAKPLYDGVSSCAPPVPR